MGAWIVLGLVVALAAWVVSIYNGLVTLRNRFKNAYAQIDVQLKRRYDLIPNLVEAAKGYLAHERQTLEAVIAARGAAVNAAQRAAAAPGDPSAMAGLAQAEGVLGGALGRLLAVMTYNTKRESFPDNVVAGLFAFKEAMLLEATESKEERQAPKVKF
jgi:LemA protein